MTDWVIPCLLAGVAAAAMGRRTDVYGALTDGAAEGLRVLGRILSALVVLLSIVSLSVIILAGAKSRDCRSYGICAGAALLLMLTGALGMKLVPADFFGVVERFSVFAATGFNAALGVHLFCAKPETESRSL